MHILIERIKFVFRRVFKVTPYYKLGNAKKSKVRILYVANSYIPTLQLSFVKPLQSLVDAGEVASELISEQQMKHLFFGKAKVANEIEWIKRRFTAFNPTHIVFCRYSGPYSKELIQQAKLINSKIIYHIDDDLLNVPIELGKSKFDFHNQPQRVSSVKYLLENVDTVYCSTDELKHRLLSYGFSTDFYVGKIYCSGAIASQTAKSSKLTIGYMGFDHAHDFELALPSLIKVLRLYPNVQFHLFGSIPKPKLLDEFEHRVEVIAPVLGYQKFMAKLASLAWDIGICPLVSSPFNKVKANTKWVEYTSSGAAVIASGGVVYDDCCADGCGMLVFDDDGWFNAFEHLINNHDERKVMIQNAQRKLVNDYSLERLQSQVLSVLGLSDVATVFENSATVKE